MAEIKKVPAIRFKGFSEGWALEKLGDIAESFDYGLNAAAIEFDGINKYIRITDIDDKTREFNSNQLTSPDTNLDQADNYKLKKGDLLFARTGASVGKTYRYKDSDGLVYFAGFLIRARIKPLFDIEFIFQSTLTDSYNSFIRLTSQRSGQPGVNAQEYSEFKVAAPSFKEQTQIGSYFQHLDKLISLHQAKVNKLTHLKKAMLEKMFPKKGADMPEIRFKGFAGAWEESKLGDLMNVTSVKRIHQSDWTSSGVRFLRARDIVASFKNEEVNEYLYITKEKYDEYSAMSGKVKPGDLLVTGVGTIGIPFLIIDETPIYFKDGNIIWFQNDTKLDGYFFYYLFTGDAIQSYIKDSAGTGTVGTFTIDSGKKTPIKIPKENEQRKIGTYFKNLDSLINLHQTELEKLSHLKKACLEKMFV